VGPFEKRDFRVSHGSQDFRHALEALMAVLEDEPVGMIIGGMAVIALGYPRVTTDIDASYVKSMISQFSTLLDRSEMVSDLDAILKRVIL
jgi:hypothetical protein